MEFSLGLVYDLIFLALLIGGAILGKRRGFVSGLVGLLGSVAGIIPAFTPPAPGQAASIATTWASPSARRSPKPWPRPAVT